jgi:hypothetical protein
MRLRFAIIGLTSAGVLMLCSTAPVSAAGSYDGSWVIDFPGAGYSNASGEYRCAAFRLPIQVSNNQISGQLGRTGTGRDLQGGQGSSGPPVTGQVQPDGTFNMSWQKFAATGKFSSAQGQATIARSECGPRQGTAQRVGQ